MSDKNDTNNGGLFKDVRESLSLVQNFYIEFFGTLVPGLLGGICLFLLSVWFIDVLDVNIGGLKEVAKLLLAETDIMTGIFKVAVFLVISYIIGAVAYRRSPKVPDAVSSYRQWGQTRNSSASDEVARMSVPFDFSLIAPKGILNWLSFWFNRGEWLLRRAGSSIDYPYPLMRKYLYCRGLKHLAEYVPWCAGSGGAAFKESFKKGVCSKTYINFIKQRLRSAGHENLILDMVRNECHIRMLCSVWYILSFIVRVAFLLMTVAAAFLVYDGGAVKLYDMFSRFVPVVLCVGLLSYCRYSSERGIHYVRTREISMVLEDVWIMDNVDFKNRDGVRLRSGDALFSDLKKQSEEFKQMHCSVCKYWKQCHG